MSFPWLNNNAIAASVNSRFRRRVVGLRVLVAVLRVLVGSGMLILRSWNGERELQEVVVGYK